MSDPMLFVCQAHQAAIRRRIYRDRVLRDRAVARRRWFGRRPALVRPAPLAGSAQAAALR